MSDEELMRVALDEARLSLEHGDVPIGAVVAQGAEILARAHNQREFRNDPTAHAEVLALRGAAEALGTWRLGGTTMFVTLEPCPMCSGALVLARVDRLVYGPADPRAGAARSLYNITQDPRLNHSVTITTGILEDECADLLRGFFEERRS